MKTARLTIIVGAILVATLPVSSSAAPLKGREVTSLDGPWQFMADPKDTGLKDSWSTHIPDGNREAPVPSVWQARSAPGYQGVAWYWKKFEIRDAWRKLNIRLRFDGIARRADIWMNGQTLGHCANSFAPLEFDITKSLAAGPAALIAVRVTNLPRAAADLPINYGGIFGSVDLIASDEAHIIDVQIDTKLNGWISANVQIENTSDKSGEADLQMYIVDAGDPKKRLAATKQTLLISPGRNTASIPLQIKKPKTWSPDTPALYIAKLSFVQGKDILDNVDETFGFREIGFADGRFTLNGQALLLRGTRYNPFHALAITGPEDEAAALREMARAKEIGLNLLWMTVHPAPPFLLRAADRAGILLVEGPEAGISAGFEAMIDRDRGHPCVLLWDASNQESNSEEIKNLSERLDRTRPVLVRSDPKNPQSAALVLPLTDRKDPIGIRIQDAAQKPTEFSSSGLPVLIRQNLQDAGPALDLEKAVAEFGRYAAPPDADDFKLARTLLDALRREFESGRFRDGSASVSQYLEKRQRALLISLEAAFRRASEAPGSIGYVVGSLNDPSFADSTGILDPWGATKAGFPIRAPESH